MGKRLLLFAEVPQKVLNMDLIKPLCEHQGIQATARQLYRGAYELFHPTWCMFACSNHAPKVVCTRGAAATGGKRRMKMMSTTAEFVANPDPTNSNQKLKDARIKRAIHHGEYSQDFFWLCATAFPTLDFVVCPGDEIAPVPARIEQETLGLYPTSDLKKWLSEELDSCPRAEGITFVELATRANSILAYEMGWGQVGDAKTSLMQAGVSTANLMGRLIAVYHHPNQSDKSKVAQGLKWKVRSGEPRA